MPETFKGREHNKYNPKQHEEYTGNPCPKPRASKLRTQCQVPKYQNWNTAYGGREEYKQREAESLCNFYPKWFSICNEIVCSIYQPRNADAHINIHWIAAKG